MEIVRIQLDNMYFMKTYYYIFLFALHTCFFPYSVNALTQTLVEKGNYAWKMDIKNINGLWKQVTTDLFGGSMNFSYPLVFPVWTRQLTPNVALRYSSNNTNALSLYGYGFSLSIPQIQRSTKKWVSEIYEGNEFTAFGNNLIETASWEYRSIDGKDMNLYLFLKDKWIIKTPQWKELIFGISENARITDPEYKDHIFAWYLEEERDLFGNKIIYYYRSDSWQPLLQSIEYAFDQASKPLYTIDFSYREKSASLVSYRTQFALESKKLLEKVTLNVAGDTRIRWYEFSYDTLEAPISHLVKIQEFSEWSRWPPMVFSYGEGQYSHFITLIENGRWGRVYFEYAPSTSYRNAVWDLTNQKVPFIVSTLSKKIFEDIVTWLRSTEEYTYENGHYYYDENDIWWREYAGFWKVTVTEENSISVFSFHQSQSSEPQEWKVDDHIAKKGKLYRQEIYDTTGRNLLSSEYIRYTTKHIFGERKLTVPMYRISSIFLGWDHRDTAREYSYNEFGDMIEEKNLWWVTGNMRDGTYIDVPGDTKRIVRKYLSNIQWNLYGFVQNEQIFWWSWELLWYQQFVYDGRPGEINKGVLTEKIQESVSWNAKIIESFVYDTRWLLVESFDAMNNKSVVRYDAWWIAPLIQINPQLWETNLQYDYFHGKISGIKNQNGVTSLMKYDAWGRTLETRVSDGTDSYILSQQNYDDVSNPNKSIQTIFFDTGSTLKKSQLQYFDGWWRELVALSSTDDPKRWIRTDTRYDIHDNKIYQSYKYFVNTLDFSGSLTKQFNQVDGEVYRSLQSGISYQYDPLDRLIRMQEAQGIMKHEYSIQKERITFANGNIQEFEKDAFGKIIAVIEYVSGKPQTTRYSYDALWNMTSMTDALSNTRNWLYDGFWRLSRAEDIHALKDETFSVKKYEYNPRNQIVKYTHPSGELISYSYDTLGRIIHESGSWIARTYTYDVGNRSLWTLSMIQDGVSLVVYSYDVFGRKIWETRTLGSKNYEISYLYNIQNQPIELRYPHNQRVLYGYQNGLIDTIGFISSTGAHYPILQNTEYGPSSKVVAQQYGNGIAKKMERSHEYNQRLSRVVISSGSENYLDTQYAYDAINNITSIAVSGIDPLKKVVNYSYDDISRLIQAEYQYQISWFGREQSQIFHYSYDTIGNIKNMSSIGDFEYWQMWFNNPHAVTRAWDMTYEYDIAGNMVWQIRPDSHIHMEYSLFGELLYSQNNQTITQYLYDHTGRRLVKSNTESLEHHITDEYEVEYQSWEALTWSGSIPFILTTEFIRIMHGDDIIATFQTQTDSMSQIREEQLVFHQSDHLGSSSLDFSATWVLLQVVDYEPFWKPMTYQVTHVRKIGKRWGYINKYLFANKQFDNETGLQYFEKRYYDNRIGKFTTQDPVFWEVGLTNRPSQYISDPDQWNTYSYVRNNPINLVDPMGEEVDYTKTEKDSSTGNSYYQVTNITTQDLDSHYTSHNGLSLQVSFSEIDTSFIQATSFDSIRNQILAWKDGEFDIDIKQAFSLRKYDDFERFGNLTLRLEWKLKINKDTWSFIGGYKAHDDKYDFSITKKDLIKSRFIRNILTLGKSISLWSWTPYDIQIRGSKDLKSSWKIRSSIPQWRWGKEKGKIITIH